MPVCVHHVAVWGNEQRLTLTGANKIPPPIPSLYVVPSYRPEPRPAYQEPDDAVKSKSASRASSALCPMIRRGRSSLSSPRSCGIIEASYATGTVSGDVAVGGLVGSGVYVRAPRSYWDMETSGLRVGVGADDTNDNGVIDGTKLQRVGVAGLATAALQAPTGYEGIYGRCSCSATAFADRWSGAWP